MENFSSYLKKIKIDISKFVSLDNVLIEKVIYFKEEKKVYFNLLSDNIIKLQDIKEVQDLMRNKLKTFKDLKLNMIYNNKDFDIKDLFDDILYIIKDVVPSSAIFLKDIEYKLHEEKLILEIKNEMLYKRLLEKRVSNSISNFLNNYSINKTVEFYMVKEDKSLNDYIEEKKEESDKIVNKIMEYQVKKEEVKINKDKTDVEEEIIGNVIIGKEINERITYLKDVNLDSGSVCIKVEIFNMDERVLKSGDSLFIMSVTDNTSSINAKVFIKEKNASKTRNRLKKGLYAKINGMVAFDNFSKELVLNIRDLEEVKKIERKDKANEKRVELHAHTQMSSMDAVCATKDLIKKAISWGHKAIAITDHGIVQAFPEAMNTKNDDIKIIYGLEGYLYDDERPTIKEPNDLDLNQEFVVFDIESTGLYHEMDEITEIGAVKIKNKEIVAEFNHLINPQMDIPYKIQELTGITNDMVKDKDSIEIVLPKFLDFIGDSYLVAHNSDFDMGFIRNKANKLNLEFKNKDIDTLDLAHLLLKEMKRYKLNTIAKKLGISLLNHHRAVDDAKATAKIFLRFLDMLEDKGVKTLRDINDKLEKIDFTKKRTNHITLLVKDYKGLRNLYELVSKSHIDYFYKNPRIPKSLLKKHKEGLIIGSACEAGEVYSALMKNFSKERFEDVLNLYDYLEIMPNDNNAFMVRKGIVKSTNDLKNINKKIYDIGKAYNKIVVATGDVHFIEPHHEIYRTILKYSQGFSDSNESTPLYFRTTDEMLLEFEYLGKDKSYEVVVKNTNKIADMVEDILPIPNETCPPVIEGSDEELRDMCYKKARRMYGQDLPNEVESRLERELSSIIKNGYAVMYIIAQKLVTKSLEDGYLVGSRGSVGSSLAATMSDITEVNPLAAHYRCEKCLYSEFFETGSYTSGADLPDKECPNCKIPLIKDGHDIPFEVFLGFEGDKEPDIDLNFAGEYQANAHKYTEVLFGKGKVYKAGTIGTVADKTAYGFSKKYIEENEIIVPSVEIERLAKGCTGIKRTSGQHPGGIMVIPSYKHVHDFTPIQYPANDTTCGVITTHFDYHSISGRILKLDILGHDVPTIIRMIEDMTGIDATKIPLDDKETMSLFTSTKALNIKKEDINCEIGSLGIPEFGTKFVRQMLLDTKPSTFGELVRISGLSHGTDVWLNNAQDLVRDGVVTLKDVISTRDDIMNYLIFKGLKPKLAFKIMEKVRKGKGLTGEDEEEMRAKEVPTWYIESCKKIKYMFPKAHAVAYVMMSVRIAYCKVHHPQAFYATYFTTKVDDFDAELIVKGKEAIKDKIREISNLGNGATTKEKNMLTVLEVALEMNFRNIELLKVDIYKSEAKKFKVVEGKLLPPLTGLQGMGENAALNIVKERKNGEFLSIEDLRLRTKISKTVIETLKNHKALDGMPETNQLSLI